MDIQKMMNDRLEALASDGKLDEIITVAITNEIEKILKEVFNWGQPVHESLRKKINELLVPTIENYSFSTNTIKLDEILTTILKETTFDNVKIIENFKKTLDIDSKEDLKVVSIETMFEKWKESLYKYTFFDSDKEYEINTVITESDHSCSSYENIEISFVCEDLEESTFSFRVFRDKDNDEDFYIIFEKSIMDISSLRHLNNFDIFILQMKQFNSNLKSVEHAYDLELSDELDTTEDY